MILKKLFKRALPFLFITIWSTGYAQKIKTEEITYDYNRPPAVAVDKSIRNYEVSTESGYEAKNKQLLADYNKEKQTAQETYQKEIAAYAGLVKEAQTRYDKELADYNKKSFGAKLADKSIGEGGKPVKNFPQKPYLAYVQKPVLQSTYDYKLLGDTYIKLEGYDNAPANALKIVVTLYGFDNTIPRNMDEQQTNLRLGGGSSGTYKETQYHAEFSYRHPMSVKVFTPAGKEILSLTPPELNSYKIYKSGASTRPMDINSELLIKTLQEKTLQENLKFINNLLNDQFGYSKVKRIATLAYIKNDDAKYQDLITAFNEASSALLMLQQDSKLAYTKLDKVEAIWNTALAEADMNNKKARINKDVAIAVYFNLLESYFAQGNATNGQATLDKMNTINLSTNDRRKKIEFEMLFSDIKSRQQNN